MVGQNVFCATVSGITCLPCLLGSDTYMYLTLPLLPPVHHSTPTLPSLYYSFLSSLVMMTFILQGRSPLWTASINGHLEVVKALIETGANVNQTNKVGVFCQFYNPSLRISIPLSLPVSLPPPLPPSHPSTILNELSVWLNSGVAHCFLQWAIKLYTID